MKVLSVLACALGFVSCTAVSDSPVPKSAVDLSGAYKASQDFGANFRPDWWRSFGDAKLNSLQSQLLGSNQDLKVALANYEASLGALGISRASLVPRVDGDLSIRRGRDSEGDRFPTGQNPFTLYRVGGQLSYEIDLWGRIRQQVRASQADAEANRFLLEQAKVSLQARLARDYFALRFLDAESDLLRRAVKTRRGSLELAEGRLEGGVSDALDPARARSLLASAEADLISLEGERARLENAIAVLVGQPASKFRLTAQAVTKAPPKVPAGLPADLLVRRPDLGAAYAQLVASSARLGVAKAGPFPRLRLTGTGGFLSINQGSLLNAASSVFNVGPEVTIPIFRGGTLKGNIQQAKARQAADLARFQQASLLALSEVESALARIQVLRRELVERDRAAAATQEASQLAQIRYDEGAATYLTVIDAEREKLLSDRQAVSTRGQLYSATIELIQALGGGFSSARK